MSHFQYNPQGIEKRPREKCPGFLLMGSDDFETHAKDLIERVKAIPKKKRGKIKIMDITEIVARAMD